MKKKILQSFSIVILISIVILFIGIGNGKDASGFEGYYEYPDTKGMSDLLIFSKCRIPEDTLKVMTDEQLVQAVLDFPRLMNIRFSPIADYDLESLKRNSDAYNELISRAGAKDALFTRFKQLRDNEERTDDETMTLYDLYDILLHERSFRGTFSEEEMEYLDSWS